MPGPISVGQNPLQLLQPNQTEGVSIQNSGSNTLYLGDSSSLTPGNYDYQISPGGSITWSPGRALWLVAAAGLPTTFNYMEGLDGASATNVTATISGTVPVVGNVNSTPVGTTPVAGTVSNNGQSSATYLGSISGGIGIGNGPGQTSYALNGSNALNISNYTSVQLRLRVSSSTQGATITFDPNSWLGVDIWQDNSQAMLTNAPVFTSHQHAEWFMLASYAECSLTVPAFKTFAAIQFTIGNQGTIAGPTGSFFTYTVDVYGLVDPAPSLRYVHDFVCAASLPNSSFAGTPTDMLASSGQAYAAASSSGTATTTASYPVTSRNKPTQVGLVKTTGDTGSVRTDVYACSGGNRQELIRTQAVANAAPPIDSRQFNAPCLPLYITQTCSTAATAQAVSLTQ